ncbi:MAG TPA: fatty acyl-AMP ligase [Thermomicrobiaceae bacterium]|nr:fatty acyl-AMP ligase [Thermomicrobiaceae bacterium]
MKQGLPDPIMESSTLVEVLRWRALHQPEQRTYTYLVDGETEGDALTYAGLDCQARSIGALLQSYRARGERALLLYPTGLEFIAAFFGCLYAGVIAVPLPPPNPAQPQRVLPRLRAIISDAQPSVVLTTAAILSNTEGLFTQAPELRRLRWLASDRVAGSLAQEWRDPAVTSSSLALVQYTSGSTAEPKGVMISHGNLIHNSDYINRVFALIPDSVTVTWLPAFHDMGLTNGIIQPVYKGRPCFLMPPVSFLMRPIRWLEAISRYKATISGGPNFAYELCTRRITPEQRRTLDLSSWDVAYNGAEPVRADTMKRFATTFASCGFRPSTFHPCYGLAEATLLVSGSSLRDEMFRRIHVAALEQDRVVEASGQHQNVRTLVSSGRAMLDTKIVIVHPESLTACAPHEVGEIWVSGPSVTQGYWNRPEETERTCRAYLKDTGEGPYLRTGDLGFIKDDELFVTGRLKDLIIISGRKLYPHDIELTVERSHPALRPACCAAFSVDGSSEEQLIIAAEVEPRYQPAVPHAPDGEAPSHPNGRFPLDVQAVVLAIRRAVAEEHDVRVHTVVLLRAGRILKTTSGKVQRRACQAAFLKGTLERFAEE